MTILRSETFREMTFRRKGRIATLEGLVVNPGAASGHFLGAVGRRVVSSFSSQFVSRGRIEEKGTP